METSVAIASNDERYKHNLNKALMLLQMAIAKVDGSGSPYYEQFDIADLLWAAHDITQSHCILSFVVPKETELLMEQIAADAM